MEYQAHETAVIDAGCSIGELRRALGTGAHTEEGALVVQGDIADRIEEWFRKRGVPKIVR